MTELEFCPFCEGRAAFAYGTYSHRSYESLRSMLEESEKPHVNDTKFVEVYCTVCKATIRREAPLWEGQPGYEKLEAETAEAWNRRAGKIVKAPAAIHARWEVSDYVEPDGHGVCLNHFPQGGLTCTNCRHGWKREAVEGITLCPNCGAIMDKEDET